MGSRILRSPARLMAAWWAAMVASEASEETNASGAIPIVDLAAQQHEIADEVTAGFTRVIAATTFIDGPEVEAFEAAWASFSGTRRAVGVGSGTDALEFALRAVGVGPGDEVIVPANSFIASAAAVVRAGARPVLVDCDDTYHLIDPGAVADAVTGRTRAIMPVHLYGQMAPMEAITAIADSVGACIVEDGAQSHGASRHQQSPGAWGVSATSFYPGKNLGAYGDGGAVVTNDDRIADAVLRLRNHGSSEKYVHPSVGFNSRLDTLQAVVLIAKLKRLRKWNEARRLAAARYEELLSEVPEVRLPQVLPGNEPVWHLYVVRVANRRQVMERLQSAGIGVGIHYPTPLHRQEAFKDLVGFGSLPVAERAASEVLSLPMHPHLTVADQERVARALIEAVRARRAPAIAS
jgi:dTDP-4-amino-4,6-dideoxygalactose transaminase